MNNESYKVSVIVPIYNVEKYLHKCIWSILNQEYKNLEIILVDDGSPDNCPKICDDFALKDERIVVIHKENGGVSSAKNSGVERAIGDYICFVDGDDFVESDYVSYLLKLILDCDADISLSESMFSNYSKEQIAKDKHIVVSGEDATVEILCYKMNIGVANKMFNANLIKNNVRFLEQQRMGEGFNFNCTAFQLARKVAIGFRKIYFYRQDNPTSATTKFTKDKWENGLNSIDEIKKNFILKSEKIINAWNFARWRTNSDVFDLMVLSKTKKTYSDFFKERKRIVKKEYKSAFRTNTSFKEKVRAICFAVWPGFIPLCMKFRKRIFHVEVNN